VDNDGGGLSIGVVVRLSAFVYRTVASSILIPIGGHATVVSVAIVLPIQNLVELGIVAPAISAYISVGLDYLSASTSTSASAAASASTSTGATTSTSTTISTAHSRISATAPARCICTADMNIADFLIIPIAAMPTIPSIPSLATFLTARRS
jgi:hypothetical protein